MGIDDWDQGGWLLRGFAAGLCLAVVGGCATSSFAGGVYRDGHTAYRVGPLDATWHRFDLSGSNLAFRNGAGGSILANSTCEGKDLSLDVLTNQALFGIDKKKERSREPLTLDGRAALRTRLSGTLDGVSVELDLVVLKKDNCTYDFQLVSSERDLAARDEEFWRFVQGFQQLPRSG